MKTYTLKVWLPPEKNIFRRIEMRADHTLITLHRAIQEAFNFDDDHLFSFFMSGKAWDHSTEYSLPENLDMGPWDDTYDEFGQPRIQSRKRANAEAKLEAKAKADWKKVTGIPFPETPQEVEAAIRTLAERQDFPLAFVRNMVLEMFAEIELEIGIRDVRRARLQDLNLKLRQTFMYVFDYGDDWRFKVQVEKLNENAPDNIDYPRIVESRGEAPAQYEFYDDDDEADAEAAHQTILAQMDATVKKYEDPAAAATLFLQNRLTEDDKKYISATMFAYSKNHLTPKYGGTAPGQLVMFSLEPYGQQVTLTGYLAHSNPLLAVPGTPVEIARMKYLGTGKFEMFYKDGKRKWQSGAKDIPYSECLRLLETDERFVTELLAGRKS